MARASDGRSDEERLDEERLDEERVEEALTYASMLRAAAERWRLRARSGELDPRRLPSTLRLIDVVERAASVLEEGPSQPTTSEARRAPRAAADAPASATELSIAGEETFRLLVDGLLDYAIVTLRPDGMVVSWNAGAERIKGYRADEVIGRHFSLIYTPEAITKDEPRRALETAIGRGRYEEEGWRVRKDGSRFWANVVITALCAESGELLGFAAVTRDHTERRAAEESLRQLAADLERRVQERTEELLAANRELEAFSYSVSHDLRAPLRALDGFSTILLSTASERLEAEDKEHLHRICAAAQRMGELIDDLLEFSRLSRAPITRSTFEVSAVAEHVVAELRRAEPERRVDVVIEPGVRVVGDARLLRVVLDHLLGNAWKFTSKRADARVELGRTSRERRALLYVRDNGVGFDMRHAGKLFIPFQRLHSAREFEGNGIGLATVRRIVERHGKRIWAESELGKGTTFYLDLEAAR